MSGPSSNYDPVEVTPLSPEEVTRMRDEAIAAINAARNLDELKAARIAHAGDRAPLTLANAAAPARGAGRDPTGNGGLATCRGELNTGSGFAQLIVGNSID